MNVGALNGRFSSLKTDDLPKKCLFQMTTWVQLLLEGVIFATPKS